MFHNSDDTSNSELYEMTETVHAAALTMTSFHVTVWSVDMEAVNQWHLGAERTQGRIDETHPTQTREQEDTRGFIYSCQSMARVYKSNHDNTNDSSLKAAQQAVNSQRLFHNLKRHHTYKIFLTKRTNLIAKRETHTNEIIS
jgi:hypothetical protein